MFTTAMRIFLRMNLTRDMLISLPELNYVKVNMICNFLSATLPLTSSLSEVICESQLIRFFRDR